MESILFRVDAPYNQDVKTLIHMARALTASPTLTDGQIERLIDIFKTLVLQYADLIALPDLSEPEADALGEILELAQDHDILGNWLTEFDHASGHALGYLEPDYRQAYKDYYALLQEVCCHTTPFDCINYLKTDHFFKQHQQIALRKKAPGAANPLGRDPVEC